MAATCRNCRLLERRNTLRWRSALTADLVRPVPAASVSARGAAAVLPAVTVVCGRDLFASALLGIGAVAGEKNYSSLYLAGGALTLVGGLIILVRVKGSR